jgi:hypothetical protein
MKVHKKGVKMDDKGEIVTRIRDIDMQIKMHKTHIREALDAITEHKNQIAMLQAEKVERLEELGPRWAQTISSEEKDDLDLDFSSIKDDSGEQIFHIDENEVKKESSST